MQVHSLFIKLYGCLSFKIDEHKLKAEFQNEQLDRTDQSINALKMQKDDSTSENLTGKFDLIIKCWYIDYLQNLMAV